MSKFKDFPYDSIRYATLLTVFVLVCQDFPQSINCSPPTRQKVPADEVGNGKTDIVPIAQLRVIMQDLFAGPTTSAASGSLGSGPGLAAAAPRSFHRPATGTGSGNGNGNSNSKNSVSTEPLDPEVVHEKLEQAAIAIEYFRRSRRQYNLESQQKLVENFYHLLDTSDNCANEDSLRYKVSFRDANSDKYPRTKAYLEESVKRQVIACSRQLEKQLSDKLRRSNFDDCDHKILATHDDEHDESSEQGKCEIDKLTGLKDLVKEVYSELDHVPADSIQLTSDIKLDYLGKALGRYLNDHLHIPIAREDHETWQNYRFRLKNELDEHLRSKCRSNMVFLKPEFYRYDDLTTIGPTHKEHLGQLTRDWMETINLCRVILKIQPFDIYLAQSADIVSVHDRLFDKYVSQDVLMSADVARDQLELLLILTEAYHVVYGEKLYKMKHFDELLETSECDKTCERSCFRQMRKFGASWKNCPNLASIFIQDYDRQFNICSQQAKEHFEQGLGQLLNDLALEQKQAEQDAARAASVQQASSKRRGSSGSKTGSGRSGSGSSFSSFLSGSRSSSGSSSSSSSSSRKSRSNGSTDSMMTMANGGERQLDKLREKIVAVLPKNENKYSIEVIRNFFPNGLALYWKEKKKHQTLMAKFRDNPKRFEKTLKLETQDDCERLEEWRMLEWNDDFGQIDPQKVREKFGPEEDKWIINANICRIILKENLGIQGAYLSVEGIV